ncbi:MAG TPA: hypothetical protein DHW82_04495 [Spirochaetia bacterium]|nr:MAG: hypothetical protein A2Y41_11875 [Spirochaetes bacterium GWB1_36_13]HCL56253.1 hypothetical protein [Spirochaetia bacterium]
MKKIILLLLVIPVFSFSYQFKGSIYAESSYLKRNESSVFNPQNSLEIGDFQYLLKGNLIFKNDFSDKINGHINLEAQYYPSFYTPVSPFYDSSNPSSAAQTEKILIKEMYLDILTSAMIIRVGKQFVKWGKAAFFNPSDVINLRKDPLRPNNEAEGNPFLYFNFPFRSSFSFEILSFINEKENSGKTRIKNLPLIPKFSFSLESLSLSCFGVFQNNKKPLFALNTDYALSLSENTNLTFYGEGIYKLRSYRTRFDDSFNPVPLGDKGRLSFTLGQRSSVSFNESKWIDTLTFTAEYFFSNENWTRQDYQNYLGFLASQTVYSDKLAAGAYFEQYRNSRHYLYTSLYFSNFIFTDFTFGNDFVFNLEDKSFLFQPSVVFSFAEGEAEAGIKALFYSGKKDSEFGSLLGDTNLILFTQLYF